MSAIKRYLEDLAIEYQESHPDMDYEEAINLIIENGGIPDENAK